MPRCRLPLSGPGRPLARPGCRSRHAPSTPPFRPGRAPSHMPATAPNPSPTRMHTIARYALLGVLVPLLALAHTAPAAAQEAPARGQGLQATALVGATFSTFRGPGDYDRRTGTIGGVSLLVPFAGPLSWQPEVLFLSRGARSASELRETVEISSVQLPTLVRLSLTPRSNVTPHLFAGPYLAFELDCSLGGDSLDCDDFGTVDTNTVDVGAIAGGGVSFLAGPLLLTGGMRYDFGVSTLAEFDTGAVRESVRHGAFSLYVGAGIRIGG